MQINSNTVVIITGASSGIGKETAIQCAKKNASVVLASRNLQGLQTLKTELEKIGGKHLVVQTDVSNHQDCKNLIAKTIQTFEKIDVLINNAGFGHYASVEKIQSADLERVFKTNLYGSLWCTQEALQHMKQRKKGHIVNVSSVVSARSIPFMSAYCMTKFAMNAMDESLRVEVKNHGIDVTLICPGLTRTGFQTNAGSIDYKPFKSNADGMDPKVVAKGMIKAIEKRKRRVVFTAQGMALYWLSKLAPSLVDEIVYKTFSKRNLL